MGALPVLLAVVVALVTASNYTYLPPVQGSMPSCQPIVQCHLCNLPEGLPLSDTYGVPPQEDQLLTHVTVLRDMLKDVAQTVKKIHHLPRHCKDLLDAGDRQDGVRMVHPFPGQPDRRLAVYCDQVTDGGGWTVFQRRTNTTVRENFYRTWKEYQLGFGNIGGEFWLGLDPLHALTSTALQELWIDLSDWEGGRRYAKYGFFHVSGLEQKYLLSAIRYNGNAGDSFGEGRHSGSTFSTYDQVNHRDGTTNCPKRHRGAWWYYGCHTSNLNGYQYQGEHTSDADGINWRDWRGNRYSLRQTIMMTRPAY